MITITDSGGINYLDGNGNLQSALRVCNDTNRVSGSFLGSLFGTSSFAITASYIDANNIDGLSDFVSTNPSTSTIGSTTGSVTIGVGSTSLPILASGTGSLAQGSHTQAIGNHSHAEGAGTKAIGQASHAEGEQTTAIGTRSHAEGQQTTAVGYTSHAEGWLTISKGSTSHAEGQLTITEGQSSHTEGYKTTSIGDYSHAEGDRTTSVAPSSHTEGILSVTIGDYSHAEGSQSTAKGIYSHAKGRKVVSNDYQVVLGTYNAEIPVEGAFIVGVGTWDTNKVNALEIYNSDPGAGGDVVIRMPDIPTSPTGLPSRSLWDNGGVINITA